MSPLMGGHQLFRKVQRATILEGPSEGGVVPRYGEYSAVSGNRILEWWFGNSISQRDLPPPKTVVAG